MDAAAWVVQLRSAINAYVKQPLVTTTTTTHLAVNSEPAHDNAAAALIAREVAKEACLRGDFDGARAALHAAFSRARTSGTEPDAQLHQWLTAVHSFIVCFVEQRAMPPAQRAGMLLKATSCIELFSLHLAELLLAAYTACTEAGMMLEARRFEATLGQLHAEQSVVSPLHAKQLRAAQQSSPSVLSRQPQQRGMAPLPRSPARDSASRQRNGPPQRWKR